MGEPNDDAPHPIVRHEGPSRTSPYPVSRLAPAYDLVDVAKEIQQADATMGLVVSGKLMLIADQIRHLQEQARQILEATQRNGALHRVPCSFKKKPGDIYHLYRRDDGTLYFSLLSPDDWQGQPPHAFEGSYRIEADMSWTAARDVAAASERQEEGMRLLGIGSGAG